MALTKPELIQRVLHSYHSNRKIEQDLDLADNCTDAESERRWEEAILIQHVFNQHELGDINRKQVFSSTLNVWSVYDEFGRNNNTFYLYFNYLLFRSLK